MMQLMAQLVLWCSAFAALAYLAVIACLLVGWGGIFSQLQRAGLALSACGMVMAGLPRLAGAPPDVGDLLFLGGLVLFLARTYGPAIGLAIFKNLDGLDGVFDGKIHMRRSGHDAQS